MSEMIDGVRMRNRSIVKKQLKHTVSGIEIIDRLSSRTKDPGDIQLLNQLRKEVKWLWQQLRQ